MSGAPLAMRPRLKVRIVIVAGIFMAQRDKALAAQREQRQALDTINQMNKEKRLVDDLLLKTKTELWKKSLVGE